MGETPNFGVELLYLKDLQMAVCEELPQHISRLTAGRPVLYYARLGLSCAQTLC
jgi:hypothetical protein